MNNMQNIQLRAQKSAIQTPKFASILIVDDQRFDRARLRRMCEQLEFEVNISEVDTLESMGTALQLETYDLIFVDYHLPGGDGLQALHAVQFDPRNRNAATIMVTGDGQSEIAINAMKNGCSDFLMKEDLSNESVRRAVINALQKAGLNRDLETEEMMRGKVEIVLDCFAKECADEIKPMLFKMMRQVRVLQSSRADEVKFTTMIVQIKNSCDRLLDFMIDIEDHERKAFALSEVGEESLLADNGPVREPALNKGKLFGRQSSRTI